MILIKTAKKKVIEKKISLIDRCKKRCKELKQYKELVKKYKKDADLIDGVTIRFCEDIDTTARTTNGEICLNNKLLNREEDVILRYILHEIVHVFQHIENEGKKVKKKDKDNYLFDEREVEAFTYQLDYQEEQEGNVEEYLEHLFNFHDLDKKEKDEVLDDLTVKLDNKDEVKDNILNDD